MISIFLVLLVGFFGLGTPAFAAGNVADISSEYNLDSYQSYMTEDGWNFMRSLDASTWLNNGANIFFDFNKVIFTTLRLGMDLFGKSSVLNSYISTFNGYSKALYDTLYANFGLTLIVIMVLYCLYLFIFKSSQRAWKQAGSFAVVMILAFGWNAKGSEYVAWFNNISTEVQASLLNAGSNTGGGSKDEAVTAMNNTLFELSIQEPYLLMNYGTADVSKINTSEEPDKAYELLFSGESSKLKYDEVDEVLNNVADSNEYLQSSKVGWKVVVAGLSPVMTLAIGIPLLVVQFMNFFVEVLVLLISAFIGLALFMSLIPRFNRAIWKVLGSLLGVFGIRILLGLSLLLLTSVIKLVRAVIVTDGVGSYILQVMTICVVIVILWKKKDTILSMITGGVIATTSGAVGKQIIQPVKDKVSSAAKLGIDVAGLAALGVPLASNGLGGIASLAKDKAKESYAVKHPSDAATDDRDDEDEKEENNNSRNRVPDIPTYDSISDNQGQLPILSPETDSDKQVDLLEDISDTLDKQENLTEDAEDAIPVVEPIVEVDSDDLVTDNSEIEPVVDLDVDSDESDSLSPDFPEMEPTIEVDGEDLEVAASTLEPVLDADNSLGSQAPMVTEMDAADVSLLDGNQNEFSLDSTENSLDRVAADELSGTSLDTMTGHDGSRNNDLLDSIDGSMQGNSYVAGLSENQVDYGDNFSTSTELSYGFNENHSHTPPKIVPFDRPKRPSIEDQADFNEKLNEMRNS
ncbi:CD3337/EF1877 family mobilome membrane protein [Enterococcus sp. HY326]|uniref:CD3337/EF1877 family mobilome membrane protein n=1 Tax=Enterococcus sp. HY326 TaxID=2971265 RepID=UPI00224063EA|nr:hypothetical protein [Enterococcus sp. HY326]